MRKLLSAGSTQIVRKSLVLLLPFVAPIGGAQAQFSFRFEPAESCAPCHRDLETPDGALDAASIWTPHQLRDSARPKPASVAHVPLWAGTMMANASRDPYWRAKVRLEARSTPAAAEDIEDNCLSCHAPLQHYDLRVEGQKLRLDDLNSLGEDGVSCTLCHQIKPDNLGSRRSFSAGFLINDRRLIYGQHPDPLESPMLYSVSYQPIEGSHISEAALCGSCHTVITPTLSPEGEVLGEFVEQAPFLEWTLSEYPDQGTTCQKCHLPQLSDPEGNPEAQFIAHDRNQGTFATTEPRSPFSQHFLVGGNVQVLGMLREMYPENAAALDATAQRTREKLQQGIRLEISPAVNGNMLEAHVRVVNETGHKLPTAYPSRRLWLHVNVLDQTGTTIFDSGAFDRQTGDIRGVGQENENFEPHHDVISDPNQVAVYESELQDSNGAFTVSLMRAAGYIKDNRVLPKGFDLNKPLPQGIDVASLSSVGVEGDEDFLPGSDTVHYEIDISEAQAPFRVTVEAYYQSIKPKHLAGMDRHQSSDEATFLDLYSRHQTPTVISRREVLVGP